MAYLYASSFFILKITRSIPEMNFGLFMTTTFMCRPSFIQQYIQQSTVLLHMVTSDPPTLRKSTYVQHLLHLSFFLTQIGFLKRAHMFILMS